MCRFNGFDDVGGIARSGNADQHVARTAQRAHLLAENMLETVVVADGGQRGSIGGQGDGGQLHAFLFKTSGHFGGKMLRVGSRTAVAANQEPAVVHQARQQQFRRLRGRFDQHLGRLLFRFDAFGKMRGNALL